MRMVWTRDEPFDFEGEFYQVRGAFSDLKSVQQPHVPLWFGGISDAAIPIGAKHCDTYALFGEPRAEIAALTQRLDAEAAVHARRLRYNVSFRPIIAATEEAAWSKARKILEGVQVAVETSPDRRQAESSRRLSSADRVLAKCRMSVSGVLWPPQPAAPETRRRSWARRNRWQRPSLATTTLASVGC